jgi:hypothetical protein
MIVHVKETICFMNVEFIVFTTLLFCRWLQASTINIVTDLLKALLDNSRRASGLPS